MMIRHGLKRTFALSPKGSEGPLGLTSLLKKAVNLPRRFLRLTEEPQENNSTYGNVTKDAFDAVSQEWQANIIGNSYDLQAYQYYD